MRHICATAAAIMAATSSVAFGQLNDLLTNTSFELNWQEAGRPPNIRGGGIFGLSNNLDAGAQLVTNFAHTGSRCLSIGGLIPGDFTGYTSDHQDSMPPNFTFLYFDVPLSWQGGDLLGSIWYNIPANQSLGLPPTENWPMDAATPFVWPAGFGPASLKFEVKGAGNGFQNNAANDGWAYAFARNAHALETLIWGDTNGEWRQLSFRWPARAADGSGWKDQVEYGGTSRPNEDPPYVGYTLPAPGTWPNPDPPAPRWPDRVKITIGRWNPSSSPAGGLIYFDDLSYTQLPEGPAPCGPADIGSQGGVPGADGVLDNNDFIVFIDYFFANSPLADRGIQGGIPGSDGMWDNNDFIVFIDQFFAGCV
jgi:hypothetical protein